MDESLENQQAFRELEKASRKLDQVESRMKRFRSKKKENSPSEPQSRAPYPDLTKYFTHLAEEMEPQPDPFFTALNP